MPLLKFKAREGRKLITVSKNLIDELEALIKCPRSYFSLEVVESKFIKDGAYVEGSPIVEVAWFDRGQDVQDEAAKIITKNINSIGYKDVDVIFTALEEKKYYENGEHF